MKYPDIDKRTRKDIIEYMKKTSITYTPEWRFDEDNPDIGTALSFIFADMFSETIKRFNRVPEKNVIAFLNSTGAKLLPAMPANGYVTLGLVNETVNGVEVRRGTQLIADVENQEEQSIIFETLNDMYVTPSKIDHIYFTDQRQDLISHIYNKEVYEKNPVPITLFNFSDNNLQEHVMYFCHDYVFQIQGEGKIILELSTIRSNECMKNFNLLLNTGDMVFEYFSQEGFITFNKVEVIGSKIYLYKDKNQAFFETTIINDIQSYWIRCTVHNIQSIQNLYVEHINIQSCADNLFPDLIHANGIDQDISEFFPFGERMTVFSECYFSSDEAFSKKGAKIQFSFTMDFIKIPLDNLINESNTNWKLIMKRTDFIPDEEFDITIEEVIWEYYNGDGWSRLFVDNQYNTIFNAKNGTLGKVVLLQFTCPEDISPILVNAKTSYFIRARVLKVNNAFKQKGAYITPILSECTVDYNYDTSLQVEHIWTRNNLVEEYINGIHNKQYSYFEPFKGITLKNPSLYLGFSIPPLHGPIKILFSMVETMDQKMPSLSYEYYTGGKWKSLNVIDETNQFRTTGILTLIGSPNFERVTLWGQHLYWIRLTDTDNQYFRFYQNKQLPSIKEIHMNTTNVQATETMEPERYFINPNEENYSIQLLSTKIHHINVWVNETSKLNYQDRNIRDNEEVRYIHDKNGDILEIWVKWEPVDSFSMSGKYDRHYIVDKNEGRIYFSNGIKGAIPPSGETETILVEYSSGGGAIGNLEPHQINRLNRTLGFVNTIYNSEITTGGCNQETTREAQIRNAAALKHGYRAVTISDYEALAMEATRNILKAKCFPNCNAFGKKDYGNITLVILQKDYQKGRKYFEQVKKQVITYMKDKISSNLVELDKFHVVEPKFLELCVQVSISVRDMNLIFDVKEKVYHFLEGFIDPITGNFNKKGWEIGHLPNTTQILNALKDIPEIESVKHVTMTAYMNGDTRGKEVDLDSNNNQFALALNGSHDIYITVE